VGSGPPGIDVADAAMKGGSPQIALQIADNVLVHNPGNEDALLTKGEALTELGQSDAAAAVFSQVLANDKSSVSGNIGLGRIELGSNPVAAEELFLEAIKHDPRNAVALNDLGIARDLQGRHTDAQTAYRQALGINPEMAGAEVNLALSLAMTGQSRDAVQLLQPLAEKPGATQQTRHDLAAVLAMSGDKTEAARILSKDLPPDQVQQALAAFTSEQPNKTASATMLNAAPAVPPPATPPAIMASANPAPASALAAPPPTTPPAITASANPAPPAAPVGTVSPVPPAVPPAAVATVSPAPPAAVPPPTQPSAPPSATQETQTGTLQVQLAGPVKSKDDALVKWGRLSRALPSELGSRQPIYAEVTEHGRTEWRVRAGGFADADEANALCQQVRAVGASCTLLQ
jgi:Flp pilus assembly protein TadD